MEEKRKFWCHYIGSDRNTPKRRSIELTKFDLIPSISDKLSTAKQPLWYEVQPDEYQPDNLDYALYLIYFQLNDKICLLSRNLVLPGYRIKEMSMSDEDINKDFDDWCQRRIDNGFATSEAAITKDREIADRRIVETKEMRDRSIAMFLNVALDYTDYLLNKDTWISTTDIAAYTELGNAFLTYMLIDKRKICVEEREKRNAERKAKELEAERMAEEQRKEEYRKEQERLADEEENFKKGESISGEDLVTLCRQHGIEMHMRTIHNLQQVVKIINGKGSCTFSSIKGKRKPSLDGCFDVATKLYNKLNA